MVVSSSPTSYWNKSQEHGGCRTSKNCQRLSHFSRIDELLCLVLVSNFERHDEEDQLSGTFSGWFMDQGKYWNIAQLVLLIQSLEKVKWRAPVKVLLHSLYWTQQPCDVICQVPIKNQEFKWDVDKNLHGATGCHREDVRRGRIACREWSTQMTFLPNGAGITSLQRQIGLSLVVQRNLQLLPSALILSLERSEHTVKHKHSYTISVDGDVKQNKPCGRNIPRFWQWRRYGCFCGVGVFPVPWKKLDFGALCLFQHSCDVQRDVTPWKRLLLQVVGEDVGCWFMVARFSYKHTFRAWRLFYDKSKWNIECFFSQTKSRNVLVMVLLTASPTLLFLPGWPT